MNTKGTRKILWPIISCFALLASYLVCRFPLFRLHGMKQWPLTLLLFGVLILIICCIFNAKKTMMLTPVGYLVGFAAGMIFAIDATDSGGGRTSNTWLIWTIVFLLMIAFGIVWDLADRRKNKLVK